MSISAADKVVHGNDLTYITQQYKNYFQAKESGKGLSTNDYTTAEKEKLAGIDASTILNDSHLTGTPVAPTASAGTNTTQVATTAFVTTAVNNAIGSVTSLSFNTDYSTYAAMAATTGSAGVIYLIPNSGTSPNSFDEYFWNGSGYEKFGTTDVDLSGYVQTSALESLTTSEITTLLNL